MDKEFVKVIAILLALIITASIPISTYFVVYYDKNHRKDYSKQIESFYSELDAMTIFENDKNDLILQTEVYKYMKNHMYNNTSGKTPKLMFIGYDGIIATALSMADADKGSGILDILNDDGKIYLMRTGGAKIGDQHTSTAPGWATLFTGKWATSNFVATNIHMLSFTSRSLMYSLAVDGYNTSFNVSWKYHITFTYRQEISSAKRRKLPTNYILLEDDEKTHQSVLNRINGTSDDAIFAIYEETDKVGHIVGHYLEQEKYMQAYYNLEKYSSEIITTIKNRPTYDSEDWMIIITNDHGGVDYNHGGRTPMEYITFCAINKSIQ